MQTVSEQKLNPRAESAKYLKRGDRTQIANDAETTTQAVSNYIAGRSDSKLIGMYFDALIEKRIKEFNQKTAEQ